MNEYYVFYVFSMSELSEVVKILSDLKIGEVAKLVKMLEEEWGVSAAAPVAVAGAVAGGASEAAAEKTSFDVVLKSAGSSKIAVIKVIRELTGLSLPEAKAIADGAPKDVKNGVDKAKAEEMKQKLEAAGASVELK